MNTQSNRTERLLFVGPIFIAVALGLGLMLTRFIFVLRDDLKASPEGWQGLLLLGVIIGGVSVIIVAVCAAAGAAVGLILKAVFAGHDHWLGAVARLRSHGPRL